MSLATDILNSLNKPAPPKPAKKPKAPRDTRKPAAPKQARTKPPEPRKFGRTRAPAAIKHKETSVGVPDVYYHEKSGGYEARAYDGERRAYLGTFSSIARAHMAVKLYKFWKRAGMEDIPTKPWRRLYTNW